MQMPRYGQNVTNKPRSHLPPVFWVQAAVGHRLQRVVSPKEQPTPTAETKVNILLVVQQQQQQHQQQKQQQQASEPRNLPVKKLKIG